MNNIIVIGIDFSESEKNEIKDEIKRINFQSDIDFIGGENHFNFNGIDNITIQLIYDCAVSVSMGLLACFIYDIIRKKLAKDEKTPREKKANLKLIYDEEDDDKSIHLEYITKTLSDSEAEEHKKRICDFIKNKDDK